MPESVLGIPLNLDLKFSKDHYDLIVLAYQPWFLSPSIPVTSLLHNMEFKTRLRNTPVVTLAGSRNMWISANERVKSMLSDSGAKHLAQVIFRDRNPNLVSAITIQYWMFRGKKERLWGLFPFPGVSEGDIEKATDFGKKTLEHLSGKSTSVLQEELHRMDAVHADLTLMFIESRAIRIFKIWASVIYKKKNRSFWLLCFKYYLIVALFAVSPIVILFYKVFYEPFRRKKLKKLSHYYMSAEYRPE